VLAEVFDAAFAPREVGVRDNFFELGGDSLLAVKLVTQISGAFNREVPLDAFLRFPTIESLARYLHAPVEASAADGAMPVGDTPDADYLSVQLVEGGDESALPKVDAVALAYIPDAFAAASGLSREDLVAKWFANGPRLTNAYQTPWGTVGIVMLPFFEVDLYKDGAGLKPATLDALRLAGRLGAKNVSLTGAIPAVTDNGRDIVTWMNGEGVNLPIITTGDATRTATVVKSVEGMIEKAGRDLKDLKVAFVGLGSIGRGTLDLMLEVLPHAKGVVLSDFYKTDERLEGIQDQLLASGYDGEITLAAANGKLPDSVYEADLIIAATSVPGAVDVSKLTAGTMLVDYSFPPAFRTIEAARRSVEAGDILFSTGGQLRLKDEVEETIFLPAAAAEAVEGIEPERLVSLAGRDGREMTGCVLASIFTGMEPEVRVTLGDLTGADALAHYRFLDGLGLGAARLQMEGYFLPTKAIDRFRGSGSSEASGVTG
jgi:acyl carrier protein